MLNGCAHRRPDAVLAKARQALEQDGTAAPGALKGVGGNAVANCRMARCLQAEGTFTTAGVVAVTSGRSWKVGTGGMARHARCC